MLFRKSPNKRIYLPFCCKKSLIWAFISNHAFSASRARCNKLDASLAFCCDFAICLSQSSIIICSCCAAVILYLLTSHNRSRSSPICLYQAFYNTDIIICPLFSYNYIHHKIYLIFGKNKFIM